MSIALLILIGFIGGVACTALTLRWRSRRANAWARELKSSAANQSRSELIRFRIAADLCPDSIYINDLEKMRIVDCSLAAERKTGYSRAQLLQMGPHELIAGSREDVSSYYERIVAAGPAGLTTEVTNSLRDNRISTTINFNRAIHLDGRTYIVTYAHDVTTQRTAERAAARRLQMIAMLSATNEAIMRVASPAGLFQQVCDAAVGGGKFTVASICIPSATSNDAVIAAASGLGAEILRQARISLDASTPEGQGLVGRAFRSKQLEVSNDFMNDSRTQFWHEQARAAGVGSAAALPLVREGTTVGVLLMYSKDTHSFDEETVQHLAHLARNVVFALENFDHELERKRAEQELLATKARLDRATRGASDGLWELNVKTHEIWISGHGAHMLGYHPNELADNRSLLLSLMEKDYRREFLKACAHCVAKDEPVDVELKITTRSSEVRWFRVRAAADRNARGEATSLAGSIQDVTQIKNYQLALIEATESAAAANKAKSEFLANMSHEIRTPMNGVIGMTELLLETPLNPMQADYAQTVRDSATALLTVLNDILDFSKVEAGKLELEILDVDVRETIEDVARLLAVPAHAKGLEVIALLDPGLPDLVRTDAGRLRQILLNLGGNAVKFTQKGEVCIECRVMEKTDHDVRVRCEVRDSGIGIPTHRIPALFQAFSQVDASTTRKFGGTGLGLSIVRRLVELMGGETGVTSEEGKGSTFWFTARFGVSESVNLPRIAPPVALRNQRVLVVDDNATNRKVLMGQLTLCHMDAVCAASADEALTLLRQAAFANRPFEIALLDHQMPRDDGASLGATIAADPVLRTTRLVLLTSSGQRGDGKMFSELGFAGYLLKPVTQRDLIDCLSMVLGVSAAVWQMQSQPIVTRHVIRAQRAQEATRILLAEDNAVNQKVACRLLEKFGYRVDVAANGQSAVDAWASGRYELILMDCQMPVMDGYEATRTIRSREAPGRHIPIIALTAHAIKGAENECTAAGMDGYLSKPIDREQLIACLDRWLQRGSMESLQSQA